MIDNGPDLVRAIRDALAAHQDPAKAAPMQTYMKSALPFRGVQKPHRVAALRPILRASALPDRSVWEATVRLLWDQAEYREERYAATDLAQYGGYREYALDPPSMPLYDHLIVTGSWWDHVDDVAIRLVGPALRAHPDQIAPSIRQWARDAHLWRRRAAVICQVRSRDATDRALLADSVLANAADPDFFLRKAIGWALREYAKSDPEWVRCFVGTHRTRLSRLSLREATRTIMAGGQLVRSTQVVTTE